MEPLESCYATLGLAPGASRTEIKRAYRTLAKVWHPDRFAADVPPDALDHFYRLTEAYQALCRMGANAATAPPVPVPFWRRPRLVWSALGVLGLGLSGLLVLSLGLWLPRSSPGLWPPAGLSASILTEPTSPPRYITVGSTREEVRAIQGPPTFETERLWEYRGSRLYFQAGRVIGWDIWPASLLQVQLLPRVLSVPRPTFFTRGSTKNDVLIVQGTPSRLTERVWEYGASRVFFIDDRVSTWNEWPGAPLMTRDDGVRSAP